MLAPTRRRTALLATIAAFLLVPAAPAAALIVELAGPGTGKVVGGTLISPEQIKCSDIVGEVLSACEHSYFAATVTLKETPGPGFAFKEWSGEECVGSTEEECVVKDAGGQKVVASFVTSLPPPTVTIEAPTSVGSREATFRGKINPNGNDAKWRFEYRPAGASAWTKLPVPDGDAGSGNTAEPVQVTAEGLEPNTEYEVRLEASNATSGETSAIETFSTLGLPPAAVTGKAWSITAGAATLAATVNPHNAEVSECRFEYGPTSAYGNSAPCVPAPGAGGTPVQVTADIEGLAPQTAYHFRVLATNACASGCGAEEGRDASFETRALITMPPRHYELVSALETDGAFAYPYLASTSGEQYVYRTTLPAPGAKSGDFPYFRAARTPGGAWTQAPIGSPAPPPGQTQDVDTRPFISADNLSIAAFKVPYGLDPDDQNESTDIYLEDTEPGAESLTWLSRNPLIEGPQTEAAFDSEVDYVSPTGGVVVFETSAHLLPADVAPLGSKSLYEWDEGKLSLLGIEPGSASGFATGSKLGSGYNGAGHAETEAAVSPDGARVVFESPDAAGNPQLYLRLDGAETVQASASAPGAPAISEPLNVSYWGADAQDSVVFFTSSSPLTADSTAPNTDTSPAPSGYGCNTNVCDLYAYDVGSGQLHDLTPAAGGGGVRRVYAVAEDGRRVYFTSSERLDAAGQLTEAAAPGETLQGLAGGPNLYLAELEGAEIGAAVKLTFVATIDQEEDSTLTYTETIEKEALTVAGVNGLQSEREIGIDPSGTVLAFRDRLPAVPGRSTAYAAGTGNLTAGSEEITGVSTTAGAFTVGAQIFGNGLQRAITITAVEGDTITLSAPAQRGGTAVALTSGMAQVFVYEAERHALTCVSCVANGAAPSAPAYFGAVDEPTARPLNVTSEGAVFFMTATPLAGAATSGKPELYEFREGKLALITSGIETQTVQFGGASADGATVFFNATGALVPGVQAGVKRIYAARTGPGPAPAATATPPCSGAECRSALAAAPGPQSIGSAGYAGPGNLPAPAPGVPARPAKKKCAKRGVRRHGRCIKARRKAKARRSARRRKARGRTAHAGKGRRGAAKQGGGRR